MQVSRREFLGGLTASAVAFPALGRVGKIDIGVVSPIKDFAEAAQSGFDYYEPPAFEVADLSEAEFARFKEQVFASPIRCTHMNFLVRKLKVVGPDANLDALTKYTEGCLDRSKQLGAQIVVWGSSITRNVPPGFSRERAWTQIRDFLTMVDTVARPRGIQIAVEPIRASSSNILSTGDETLKMVREVNRPSIRMVIDFYQLRAQKDDVEVIWRARKEIIHLHFANVEPHAWPKSLDGDPEFAHFFSLVKKMDYRGGLSIEAPGSIAENAPATLAFLRQQLG